MEGVYEMIIENSVVLKITDADVNDGVLCLPDEATVLKADVTGISSPMRSKIRELRGNNIQSIEAFTDHCGKRSALTPTFPALELFNMPKLKEIPKEAFVQHKMLKKVELSSVKYVREMAFEDSCIETVILPEVKTIYEAASIAAWHSKASGSSNVPVDYVPVRYVKKPNGAKPGMVIFTHNQTVYVDPKLPGDNKQER